MDSAAQYALAYALTTSTGIRALLPLALVSIAVHLGYVHTPASYVWLGSTMVTLILAGVALLEVFADKIPLLDHALHLLIGLMVIGALNALGIHAFTSSVRVASTATTAGIANPFISLFEDVTAAGVVVLALVLPFLAAALALIAAVVAFRLARSAYRRVRA
jgi:hypothetical protein